VDVSIKSIFDELISSPKAKEFGTFDESQIPYLRRRLLAESSDYNLLRFAKILIEEYPFEQLHIDDGRRKSFAYAMAQCWIFTRTNSPPLGTPYYRNCFASPLSVIISSDYELVLDEITIIERLTNTKTNDLISPRPSKVSIDYNKRFSQWEFLKGMYESPICELKTLVLIANAMSTQTHLLEFSLISGDKTLKAGIEMLSKRGLLLRNAPKGNSLAIVPLEQLKQFAIKNGIEKTPTRKDELISLIIENCKPADVSAFINILMRGRYYKYGNGYTRKRYIQSLIPNAKIFQEYVRSELHRLELYLEFIGCIEYENRTVISPFRKRNQIGDRPGDPIEKNVSHDNNKRAFSALTFISNVNPNDLQTIQEFWDDRCNILLSKAIVENPYSLPSGELVSEILAYWNSSGILKKYKVKTQRSGYKKHWFWLLNTYASYLLGKDKENSLNSTELICNGCGQVFKEWSITLDIAWRVKNRIEFCESCYRYIFFHSVMANTTQAFQIPQKDMLGFLFDLSKTLGFIPTRTYMENIELPAQPVQKQIEIGKILLKMPSYDIYIEKFGNWFKGLTLAGILDDGHRQMSRGIQCLANDGHLCLSLGEKAIDDWLSDHNITHEKESLYPYDEEFNPNELSRVDWKIGEIYIEYAGLLDDSNYANKIKRKSQLAKKKEINLLIVEPKNLFELDEILGFLEA
jgi:hypothetical protein